MMTMEGKHENSESRFNNVSVKCHAVIVLLFCSLHPVMSALECQGITMTLTTSSMNIEKLCHLDRDKKSTEMSGGELLRDGQ